MFKPQSLGLLVFATTLASAQNQTFTIASGVPLHVRVTHTAKLSTGSVVEGVLTEPIYVRDRLVLPTGAAVRGTVTGYEHVERKVRVQALLNGDVTPLHNPVVDFDSLTLAPSGAPVSMHTHALIRTAQLVSFVPATKRPSLYQQGKTMVKQRVADTKAMLFGPYKKDRAVRFLYSQLPYHPQRIWAGTQFIADLESPTAVALPFAEPQPIEDDPALDGVTVMARIDSQLDSQGARKGDAVTAILTQPVFDASHNLLLAEGAQLEGTVTATKPARSFGRNGQLRFAFRGVKANDQPARKVFGTLTAAEGSASENITVDHEGNVSANPDKNRFVAPLLLALTAAAGHDEDHHGTDGDTSFGHSAVASNGLGVVARVVALTAKNANVATGFGAYAFAKSIYFRFLTRGHEVSFPKDTLVKVQLSVR